MNRRRFGRTGLEISAIAFGGGWVGGLLIDADDDTRRRAVRRALDAGVDWFDTAAQYGRGKSEEALGWLLAEVPDRPRLSTKVSVDPSLPVAGLRTAIEAGVERSLARLRRPSVDLLFLHNPIAAVSGARALGVGAALGPGGAGETLERLRDRGVTKSIGITALGEPEACAEVLRSGRFDAAQVYYNLLNPSAGRAVPSTWAGQDFGRLLDVCREQDLGVMAIRVLAAGVLATDVRTGREVPVATGSEVGREEARARAVFAALGEEHGTRAQRAIRFALSHPAVSTVVVGLARVEHLDEALGAEELGPLPAAALDRLADLYAGPYAEL